MNKKQRIVRVYRRLAWITVVMLAALISSLIIHESGHFMMADALDLKPDLKFHYIAPMIPYAGKVAVTGTEVLSSRIPLIAFYLAGGFYAAIFPWLFIWYVSWRTPEKGDIWIEGVSASVVLFQVLYSFTELFLYQKMPGWYDKSQIPIALAAMSIFLFLYAKVLVNWLDAGLGTPGRKLAHLKKNK